MSQPALTYPELGQSITIGGELAYRAKKSSLHQAETWNMILADDPEYGPSTGFIVGVAPLPTKTSDGPRYELIWVTKVED